MLQKMAWLPTGPSRRKLCKGGCNGLNFQEKGVVIGCGH